MVTPKSPVFLFAGNDSYLREKALEELGSSVLDSSSKQLDYNVFYAGDSDIREVLDCAGTIPLASKKKVIVIKEADRFNKESKARLAAYIRNPVSSTYLVLQSEDESFLDSFDDLARYVNIRRFDHPAGEGIDAWIRNFLSSACSTKRISQDAVEALRELQGQNLLSLEQELGKLIAFTGNRAEISPDDVEEVVGKSLSVSAFDLTDAIELNNIGDAMRIISELILSGKKHYEIIGLLCWHLKRVMKARIARDRGESDPQIVRALRIHSRFAVDFLRQLAVFDIGKIRARMQILLEADLDLKRTKYDPALILEFAVIKMCLI